MVGGVQSLRLGIGQIDKPVGPIDFPRKIPCCDPLMTAFARYGHGFGLG